MLINDPRSDDKIDVTGWELDFLNDLVAAMRSDILVGSDRDLAEDEIDALTDGDNPVGLLASPAARDLHLGNPIVRNAVERLGEILHEALFQRDLPRALGKVNGALSGELTAGERLAYGEYIDGLGAEELSALI